LQVALCPLREEKKTGWKRKRAKIRCKNGSRELLCHERTAGCLKKRIRAALLSAQVLTAVEKGVAGDLKRKMYKTAHRAGAWNPLRREEALALKKHEKTR